MYRDTSSVDCAPQVNNLIQKYCLLLGGGGNDVFDRTIYYWVGNRSPPPGSKYNR